ncbi:hypothetical protein AAVH_18671 [Aphelenchoides avenae]|nr:hypothetical protein AAVH_18671 [Aphelenchus avenae]
MLSDFGDSGLRLYDLYLRASDRMPKRISPAIEVIPVHVGQHEFADDEDGEERMVVTRPKRILNNAMRDWVLYRHRLMPMEL